VHKAGVLWGEEARAIARELKLPAIVGEWSLGLNQKMVDRWAKEPCNYAPVTMDEFQLSAAYRGYASAQLLTFEKYAGWFFWTYRTETTPEWSYRDCVEQGFIPDLGRPEQMVKLRATLERAKNPAA